MIMRPNYGNELGCNTTAVQNCYVEMNEEHTVIKQNKIKKKKKEVLAKIHKDARINKIKQ